MDNKGAILLRMIKGGVTFFFFLCVCLFKLKMMHGRGMWSRILRLSDVCAVTRNVDVYV